MEYNDEGKMEAFRSQAKSLVYQFWRDQCPPIGMFGKYTLFVLRSWIILWAGMTLSGMIGGAIGYSIMHVFFARLPPETKGILTGLCAIGLSVPPFFAFLSLVRRQTLERCKLLKQQEFPDIRTHNEYLFVLEHEVIRARAYNWLLLKISKYEFIPVAEKFDKFDNEYWAQRLKIFREYNSTTPPFPKDFEEKFDWYERNHKAHSFTDVLRELLPKAQGSLSTLTATTITSDSD